MKNGIRPSTAGWDIVVDGVDRTHRDLQNIAYDTAIYLKTRNPQSVIQVRNRESGTVQTVLPDGRMA